MTCHYKHKENIKMFSMGTRHKTLFQLRANSSTNPGSTTLPLLNTMNASLMPSTQIPNNQRPANIADLSQNTGNRVARSTTEAEINAATVLLQLNPQNAYSMPDTQTIQQAGKKTPQLKKYSPSIHKHKKITFSPHTRMASA